MEAPKPKQQEEGVPAWGKFWKTEAENLKLRTGMLQYERLSEDELNSLIGLMTQECKKPPFDRVPKSTLQNILHEAAVEERFLGKNIEFIGYSVRWVRQVLNAWWQLYGDKWLQKWQLEDDEKRESEKKVLAEKNKPQEVENPHEDIKVTVQNYLNSLIKPVPRLSKEEILREGQERAKVKALSATYEIDHVRNIQINLQHKINELAIEGYSHLRPVDKVDFKVFVVDGIYKVNCASMQDAEEIYREAKNRLGL